MEAIIREYLGQIKEGAKRRKNAGLTESANTILAYAEAPDGDKIAPPGKNGTD